MRRSGVGATTPDLPLTYQPQALPYHLIILFDRDMPHPLTREE